MNDCDEYPYNVAVPGTMSEEMFDWLDENMPDQYGYAGWALDMVISFGSEKDAITFKLTWC